MYEESLRDAARKSQEIGGTCWYWWPSFYNRQLYIGVDNNAGVMHYCIDHGKKVEELTAAALMRRMEDVL